MGTRSGSMFSNCGIAQPRLLLTAELSGPPRLRSVSDPKLLPDFLRYLRPARSADHSIKLLRGGCCFRLQ